MPDVPKLDHVATLKLSAAQHRRCKAAARAQGMRFSVWARNILIANANKTLGPGGGLVGAPPTIPTK